MLRETTGECWSIEDMDQGAVCATSGFGDGFLAEEMHEALKPSGQGFWAEAGWEQRSWQACGNSEWLTLFLGRSAWESILGFTLQGLRTGGSVGHLSMVLCVLTGLLRNPEASGKSETNLKPQCPYVTL